MKKVTVNRKAVKYLYCGIDLHDRNLLTAVAAGKDPEAKFRSYPAHPVAVKKLIADLNELKKAAKCRQVWVGYEASGSGFLLADTLLEAGFRVSVLAPSHLPVSLKSRSRKTDREDARRIFDMLRAHCLAGMKLPEVSIPDQELRDHRELVRRRIRLGEEVTKLKSQIHGLLKRNGIRKPEGMDNWTRDHLAWLERVGSESPEFTGWGLKSLLRQLRFLEDEMAEADKLLKSLSRRDRYREPFGALIGIPGVGQLTAMTFLVELGDLNRFGNRRQVGSYLGLTPRSYESGETSDRKGHISRMGPARVRRILNQAAWSLVQHDRDWGDWFAARTPNKSDRKRMIVAVMRKLSIVMWHRAKEATVRSSRSRDDSSSSPASRVSVTKT